VGVGVGVGVGLGVVWVWVWVWVGGWDVYQYACTHMLTGLSSYMYVYACARAYGRFQSVSASDGKQSTNGFGIWGSTTWACGPRSFRCTAPARA